MADIEKERAAFEAWAREQAFLERDDGSVNLRWLGLNDVYVDFSVHHAWHTWQAARALPPADAAEMKRLADALEEDYLYIKVCREAAALLRRMAGG